MGGVLFFEDLGDGAGEDFGVVEGEEVVTQPEVTEKKGRATNLMAALEASLASAKSAAGKNGSRSNGHAHHVAAARSTRRRRSA